MKVFNIGLGKQEKKEKDILPQSSKKAPQQKQPPSPLSSQKKAAPQVSSGTRVKFLFAVLLVVAVGAVVSQLVLNNFFKEKFSQLSIIKKDNSNLIPTDKPATNTVQLTSASATSPFVPQRPGVPTQQQVKQNQPASQPSNIPTPPSVKLPPIPKNGKTMPKTVSGKVMIEQKTTKTTAAKINVSQRKQPLQQEPQKAQKTKKSQNVFKTNTHKQLSKQPTTKDSKSQISGPKLKNFPKEPQKQLQVAKLPVQSKNTQKKKIYSSKTIGQAQSPVPTPSTPIYQTPKVKPKKITEIQKYKNAKIPIQLPTKTGILIDARSTERESAFSFSNDEYSEKDYEDMSQSDESSDFFPGDSFSTPQTFYTVLVHESTNRAELIEKARLIETGNLMPEIISKTFGGTAIYRLIVGHYYERAKAYNLSLILKNKGFRSATVITDTVYQ